MHYVIVCVHLHLIMKLLKMIWSDPPVYWCCYVSPYKDICRYSIIFIKLKQSPPPYICIIYSPIPFLGVYCFPKIGRNLSLTHDHHHNLRPNRITKWIKLNLKVTIVVKSDGGKMALMSLDWIYRPNCSIAIFFIHICKNHLAA